MRLTLVATGNVTPRRVVQQSTSENHSCSQASSATQKLIGICAGPTRTAPYTGLADGYHAVDGESVHIFGPGEDDVEVDAGGTIAAGDRLTADSDGKVVATTTTGNVVIAIAKEAATSGKRVKVSTVLFIHP